MNHVYSNIGTPANLDRLLDRLKNTVAFIADVGRVDSAIGRDDFAQFNDVVGGAKEPGGIIT